MRAVNKRERYIAYTLNILGLRVFQRNCELIAKQNGEWVSIGSPAELPIQVSVRPGGAESDPLLLTIQQYHSKYPGTDLLDVVEGRRSFEVALER